jgi:hypothetical protein
MSESQTLATHRRFHPLFHFVAFPLSAIYLVWTLRTLLKVHSFASVMDVLAAFTLVLAVFLGRYYGLRVQDRLIRLEETLRMRALFPTELQARIGELSPGQFVGLRFASDEELASLVEAALKENLGGEELKKRIKTWRPDTFRV